jgi:hypothetical protein
MKEGSIFFECHVLQVFCFKLSGGIVKDEDMRTNILPVDRNVKTDGECILCGRGLMKVQGATKQQEC